jgi:hypothetical protein
MTRLTILAVALLVALATPASAQRVIYNPGWCAQFYPNANCQNYGPGNPYTSYGWRGTYGYCRLMPLPVGLTRRYSLRKKRSKHVLGRAFARNHVR